jgi:hypothetical protein
MEMGAHGYVHKDGRIQALPEQLGMIVRSATARRTACLARDSARLTAPESTA